MNTETIELNYNYTQISEYACDNCGANVTFMFTTLSGNEFACYCCGSIINLRKPGNYLEYRCKGKNNE